MWCIVDQSFDKSAIEFTYESMADFRRTAELLDRLAEERPQGGKGTPGK